MTSGPPPEQVPNRISQLRRLLQTDDEGDLQEEKKVDKPQQHLDDDGGTTFVPVQVEDPRCLEGLGLRRAARMGSSPPEAWGAHSPSCGPRPSHSSFRSLFVQAEPSPDAPAGSYLRDPATVPAGLLYDQGRRALREIRELTERDGPGRGGPAASRLAQLLRQGGPSQQHSRLRQLLVADDPTQPWAASCNVPTSPRDTELLKTPSPGPSHQPPQEQQTDEDRRKSSVLALAMLSSGIPTVLGTDKAHLVSPDTARSSRHRKLNKAAASRVTFALDLKACGPARPTPAEEQPDHSLAFKGRRSCLKRAACPSPRVGSSSPSDPRLLGEEPSFSASPPPPPSLTSPFSEHQASADSSIMSVGGYHHCKDRDVDNDSFSTFPTPDSSPCLLDDPCPARLDSPYLATVDTEDRDGGSSDRIVDTKDGGSSDQMVDTQYGGCSDLLAGTQDGGYSNLLADTQDCSSSDRIVDTQVGGSSDRMVDTQYGSSSDRMVNTQYGGSSDRMVDTQYGGCSDLLADTQDGGCSNLLADYQDGGSCDAFCASSPHLSEDLSQGGFYTPNGSPSDIEGVAATEGDLAHLGQLREEDLDSSRPLPGLGPLSTIEDTAGVLDDAVAYLNLPLAVHHSMSTPFAAEAEEEDEEEEGGQAAGPSGIGGCCKGKSSWPPASGREEDMEEVYLEIHRDLFARAFLFNKFMRLGGLQRKSRNEHGKQRP
ncbi:uncharacterized protein [Heterodontus francisci]|uniref:uncharacterized protein n=1 Tax=Heterodontus francisci TaxID=7792 RepID=UPI00355B667B